MKKFKNHPLKSYHTFHVDVFADEFLIFENEDEIVDYVKNTDLSGVMHLVLGEGSNVLLRRDFPGRVLKVHTRGISVLNEDGKNVTVKVSAGENWDSFVEYCVSRGWGGPENLSLIPGNIGSSPIQNIGAYGTELSDFFLELEAVEILTGKVVGFSREDCKFGYRDSIFKSAARGRYIILNVTFLLDKERVPDISYRGVMERLSAMGVADAGIGDVRNAIISIRREKLPDPDVLGNAGSFFKNPEIDLQIFEALKEKFPAIPGFPLPGNRVKVPAAWLIEQAGWKGRSVGNAGVYENQPLVIVNLGNAGGKEIADLASRVKGSVWDAFGIPLENEVNII